MRLAITNAACLLFLASAHARVAVPLALRTCVDVTEARPGIGIAFRGVTNNDGYNFHARIPGELTGWSGTAKRAPFHGFTMFPADQLTACIVFEIHIRIDDEDVLLPPPGARPISLGKARGWQAALTGTREGTALENVVTSFSVPRRDHIDDGSITLVTTARSKARDLRLYRQFVASVKFVD